MTTQQVKRRRAKRRLFLRKTKRYTKASCLTVWRLVLFVLMLLLLLFCTVWLLFLRVFNAQHLNERITAQLQQKLNRPVKISSLEFKFVNTLELKGFYVVDTEGEPGQALLSADSVTLRFALLPLLEQKLVINEVSLNSPRFNLVRLKDSSYNLPSVKQNSDNETSTYTSAGGRRFQVSVEDWRIRKGVFNFKDQISGASHALYDFNARFDNLHFNQLSHFYLEMVLRNEWQDQISELEIEMDGQVNFGNFNWSAFVLKDVKTQVSVFDDPVDITFNLADLNNPSFDISTSAPAFKAENLSQFGIKNTSFEVPVSLVKAEGKITDNYSKAEISSLSAAIGDIKLTGSGQADLKPLNMQLKFDTDWFALADKKNLLPFLADYRLSGDGKASGIFSYRNGDFMWSQLNLQAKNLTGNFYGFLTEKANAEFQAKNNFEDLYGRTTGGKLTVADSVFDKLTLSASWRKGNLYAVIESAELNEVPMKLDVSVTRLKSDNRQIHTRIYFKNFDPMAFIGTVQDFVTVISPLTGDHEPTPEVTGELAWLRNFRDRLPNFMPNFSGTLTADTFTSGVLTGNDFNAQFNFTGMTAGAKNLSGPLQLQLKQGTIHQMEKWAEEQEALNVTFQPFIMMHRMERAGSFSVGKVLRDVAVTELGTSVTFENGRMHIHNAYTVGPIISAAISGWTDWVAETLDLTIYTMFTNTSKSGVLAENLTDESGNPALAFRISSSMTKTKLEMLRAKQAGKTIQKAHDAGVGTNFEEATQFTQGGQHATK